MRFSFSSLRKAPLRGCSVSAKPLPNENRKALPTSSIRRAVIFVLSLGLSLSIGMTSIHATVVNEKIKEQSAPDLSWWPVILLDLFIFYLISAHGKVGCLILTGIFTIILLSTGQYWTAFLCILLMIAISSPSTSGGNYDPDDYNDVD
jgi:ABC-type tungstate transport system substrate-binding protein